MHRRSLAVALLLSTGCTDALVLPDDPTEAGAAVGVRTIPLAGRDVDVWYPARGDAGSSEVALSTYVPDAFVDALDGVDLPTWTQAAVVDAPPRRLEDPLPVVVFSHGFGGFRAQSTQLTAHLASRGYVVLSTDHPGRDLATLAPCLVTVEGLPCEVGVPGGPDPAVDDVTAILDALGDLPEDLLALADVETLGMFGHSAGGNTTAATATADDRIDAALPMAGGGALDRDLPSLIVGGQCDDIVQPAGLIEAGPTYGDGYWSLDGAGHLAFSDLCLADLGGVADDLEEVEGANGVFLSALRSLATDGCPDVTPTLDDPACADGFAPLDETDPALRYLMTTFFDATLKGLGDGPDADAYPALRQP